MNETISKIQSKKIASFWDGFTDVEVVDKTNNELVTILVPTAIKDDQEQVANILLMIKDTANLIENHKSQESRKDFIQIINKLENDNREKHIAHLSKVILYILIKVYANISKQTSEMFDQINQKAFSESNKNRMIDRIKEILGETMPFFRFSKELLIWTTAHSTVLKYLEKNLYNREYVEYNNFLYKEEELELYFFTDFARALLAKMKIQKMSVNQLEILLGLKAPSNNAEYHELIRATSIAIHSLLSRNIVQIPSTFLYHKLSMGIFSKFNGEKDETNPWPQLTIKSKDDTLFSVVTLKPRAVTEAVYVSKEENLRFVPIIKKLTESMGELTVDVMNAVFAIYFSMNNNEGEWINIDADTILDFLAMQRKKGKIYKGKVVRGGFEPEQREQIKKQIEILSNIYLHVTEKVKYGKKNVEPLVRKGFLLEFQRNSQGVINNYLWQIRPNPDIYKSILGSGGNLQYEVISTEILKLNPYKNSLAKRLAYYFSYLWKVRSSKIQFLEPIGIDTILNGIHWDKFHDRPAYLKSRIDLALDELELRGIISGYSQDKNNQLKNEGKGIEALLSKKIIVEPPELIIEHYIKIKKIDDQLAKAIKNIRLKKGYKYIKAAEEIKITPSTLLRFELGKEDINEKENQKIIGWHNKNKELLNKQK